MSKDVSAALKQALGVHMDKFDDAIIEYLKGACVTVVHTCSLPLRKLVY